MNVLNVRPCIRKSYSQILVIHKPALFHMKLIRLLIKATRMASNRGICCLSSVGARVGFQQRQLKWLPTGKIAAFDLLSKIK